MRFFGRGRVKKQPNSAESQPLALGDALDEVYLAIFQAAALSTEAVMTTSEMEWNAKLEPHIGFAMHCEFYYFYAHFMDWLAFHELGEKGRDLIADMVVDSGIIPLVKGSWPNAGDEV